ELRAVQPALDEAALDLAVREGHRPVGADVRDRVPAAVAVAHDRDLDDAPVLGRELDAERLLRAEVGRRAGGLSGHADASAGSALPSMIDMDLLSSRSIASSRRSSTDATPISWMSSAKKPRTTRRRASISGMPRACR